MKKSLDTDEIVQSLAWSAGPGCHGGCGVLLHVKDGKLQKIEGNANHPYNQGRLCPRALVLKEYMYHPDRLKKPLKRVGKRGEGKWQEMSWGETYDYMEEKMREIRDNYGAESMVFVQGTGRNVGGWLVMLAYAYGSPNWLQGGISGNSCYHPRLGSMAITEGAVAMPDAAQFLPQKYDDPDWVVPECTILWGQNPIPTCTDGFYGHWFVDLMRRGTKFIVIDPTYTWMASKADIWLQIRPGTDGALALSMLNVIINEGLYDREFVEKWTYGFDKLRQRVQDYPPSRVSEITWIPEEKIVETARFFATSHPANIQMGVPIDMAAQGVHVSNAIVSLWAITGNIDIPGGMVLAAYAFGVVPYPMSQEAVNKIYGDRIDEAQLKKRIGTETFGMVRDFHWRAQADMVTKAMLTGEPYPIKAAWIAGNNALVTGANPNQLLRAFDSLEFIVVADLFMSPTAARLADVVLPAATFPERDVLRAWWSPLNAFERAVTVEDCKPDEEICLEMARRLNPNLPWKTAKDLFNYMLKNAGLTFEAVRDKGWMFPPRGHPSRPYKRYEKGLLRKDGKPGFNTPTGKVELYSTLLEKWGHDPLPYYEEPQMSPVSTPELAKEYPLILTSGRRTSTYYHSEHRMIRSLRELEPYPDMEIHPETARLLGIGDGDWVWIENPSGRCKRKARYSDRLHPKVVEVSHGWWLPEKAAEGFGVDEVNINLLIPDRYGETGFGGGEYKSLLCKVYVAGSGIEGLYERRGGIKVA